MKKKFFVVCLLVLIMVTSVVSAQDEQGLLQMITTQLMATCDDERNTTFEIQWRDVVLTVYVNIDSPRNALLSSWLETRRVAKYQDEVWNSDTGKNRFLDLTKRILEIGEAMESMTENTPARIEEFHVVTNDEGEISLRAFPSFYIYADNDQNQTKLEIMPMCFYTEREEVYQKTIYLYFRCVSGLGDGSAEITEWIIADQELVYDLVKMMIPYDMNTDAEGLSYIIAWADEYGGIDMPKALISKTKTTVESMRGIWTAYKHHEYLKGIAESSAYYQYIFDGDGSYAYYVGDEFGRECMSRGNYQVEDDNTVYLYSDWGSRIEIKIIENSFDKDGRTYRRNWESEDIVYEQPISNSHIIKVAGGDRHTVGLRKNGDAVAVGMNSDGETNVRKWNDLIDIDARCENTVGLTKDGYVVVTGDNRYGQLSASQWEGIVDIAMGDYHVVGLQKNGRVVTAGRNHYGQGDVSQWKKIIDVAAGGYHTLGLLKDGTVIATGDNRYGQTLVSEWRDIAKLACGRYHTVGLKKDGTVVATGKNENGECNVSDWTDIIAVAAGASHTVGLRRDGTVVAVGRTREDQCDVDNWESIVAIACGSAHTIGVRADGSVVAVGWDMNDCLNVSGW